MTRTGERGFGMIDLILTLGVLVGVLYFVMKQHSGGKTDEATLRRLETSGVALPAGAALSDPKSVENAVQVELQKATVESEHRAECATSEGSCKAQ